MAGFELTHDADQLAAGLAAAARAVGELEPVNQAAGAVVVAAPAPRRSGRMGDSVRAAATTTGVTVAAHTPYWTFVHWGAPRRHIIARPWLLAGLEANQEAIIDLYRSHLADSIATIGE